MSTEPELAISTEHRAAYIDESGERQPSWKRVISDAPDGHVSVYGNHLIGTFGTAGMEVRGGQLYLYAFDGDDVEEVVFTAEESRDMLRAASHMLVANTQAAVKVLKAEPEMQEAPR